MPCCGAGQGVRPVGRPWQTVVRAVDRMEFEYGTAYGAAHGRPMSDVVGAVGLTADAGDVVVAALLNFRGGM
jgi:hypothetical protein